MKLPKLLLVLAAIPLAAFAQAPTSSDPARLALAHEVIAAMKADRMFDAMAKQMKQLALQMAPQTDATPAEVKRSQELQGKIMDLSMSAAKGMIAKMDQIYVDVYTDAELRAMKAFFMSSEGQSMLSKQPQILARVMPLAQDMQRSLGPEIQRLVEESRAEASSASPAPAGVPAPQPAAPTPSPERK